MEAMQRSLLEEPDILPLIWIHDYHLTLVPSILRQVSLKKKKKKKKEYIL